METRNERGARANALRHEIAIAVEVEAAVPAEVVYDALVDLRSHLVWAGEAQRPKTRLVSLEAPAGAAAVGTEFTTSGLDPMGRFTDRSVVTEATRPSAFEFVTEARLVTKRGAVADWTNVHRYNLAPTPAGCRVTYTIRVARISALPGALALFNVRALSPLVVRASRGVARRGVRNLARFAEERGGSSGRGSGEVMPARRER